MWSAEASKMTFQRTESAGSPSFWYQLVPLYCWCVSGALGTRRASVALGWRAMSFLRPHGWHESGPLRFCLRSTRGWGLRWETGDVSGGFYKDTLGLPRAYLDQKPGTLVNFQKSFEKDYKGVAMIPKQLQVWSKTTRIPLSKHISKHWNTIQKPTKKGTLVFDPPAKSCLLVAASCGFGHWGHYGFDLRAGLGRHQEECPRDGWDDRSRPELGWWLVRFSGAQKPPGSLHSKGFLFPLTFARPSRNITFLSFWVVEFPILGDVYEGNILVTWLFGRTLGKRLTKHVDGLYAALLYVCWGRF